MEQNSKTASPDRGIPTSASVGIMNVVYLISSVLAALSAYVGRDSAPYAMSLLALCSIFLLMLLLNNFPKMIPMNGRIVTVITTLWMIWMSIAFGKELGQQNYLLIALIALLIFSRKGLFRSFSVVLLILITTVINYYQRYYQPLFPVPDLINVLFLINIITPLLIVAMICWKAVEYVTQSQEVIELQKQHLLESITFKDKILSIIGHDMRTPFSGAKSIIYLLESDMLTDTERKAVLKELSSAIDVSLQTLDNILGWASQGYYGSVLKMKTKLELLKPYYMVQHVMAFFELLATQKMVKFKNEIPSTITLAGDQEQISFVLRNITSNAIKFSHSGQTITFTAVEEFENVTVSIIDQGVGMTQETIDSLFEISTRFSKEGTTHEKGTGLGLIFCKDFIENNGGKLIVNSSPGFGTTMSFSLPKK